MRNLFVICVSLLTYFSSYAQDPQLFENPWYLNRLLINGNNNPAPANSDLNFITLNFYESTTDYFVAVACDSSDGLLDFDQLNPKFSISQYGMVFWSFCSFQPNIDYSNLYFSFFENEINFPFVYEISSANGIIFLTITNEAGDRAFYADQLFLSFEDRYPYDLVISPNPFTDTLTISLTQGEIVEIHVYNLLGQEVFEQKGNNQKIYLEDLNSGVYFLKVFTDKGNTTKKIIKMN